MEPGDEANSLRVRFLKDLQSSLLDGLLKQSRCELWNNCWTVSSMSIESLAAIISRLTSGPRD